MKSRSLRLLVVCFVLAAFGPAHGQGTFVIGSQANVKTTYVPGAGYNRLLVATVSREQGTPGTVSSMSYGAAAMTFGFGATQGNVRTEIWYLAEAGIRTGGYCGAAFTVTWSSGLTGPEVFGVITLKDIDQTTPKVATVNVGHRSATSAGATTLATGNMSGPTAGDVVVYGTSASNSATHTAAAGYTERTYAVSAGTVVSQAMAVKETAAGGTENPTATWSASSALIIVGVVFNGTTVSPTATQTFYSRATGAWDDNNTWSLSEATGAAAVGTGIWPRRTDHVIIKSGHVVTIDAIDDNKTCGVSATSLAIANVGQGAGGGTVAFDNSTSASFYQTGNVVIRGQLTMSGGVNNIMTSGNTTVVTGGTFQATSNYYNLGYFEVQSGSTFTTSGNFIISGSSTSLINNAITITNDFGLDFTSATICGNGVASLGLGVGSAIIYTNGATNAQMCSSFSVACPGGGCSGAPAFPAAGTTVTITGNSGPAGIGNSTFNRLWLKANDLTGANGSKVTAWADASGNGNNAAANANPALDPLIQPTLATNSQNSLPAVTFDGGDYLSLGTPASLNLIGQTDPMTFFGVFNMAASAQGTFLSKAINNAPGDNRQYQFQVDGTGPPNRFTVWAGTQFNQGAASTTGWQIGTAVLGTGSTAFTTFVNDVADLATGNIGTTSTNATVLVGARRNNAATTLNSDFGFPLTGSIAEIIFYRAQFNAAQRIIMHNYLSAKYNIGISVANNLYTGDNIAFDFEVAGIGQAADGSNHKDAKGTGPVRMWNPSAMGNGEFMIWGHNGATYNQSVTGAGNVDNVVIKERLVRLWKLTETGDIGTVNISFDIAALGGTVVGSNIRLLIDRDGNLATNDVTPIVAGSYAGSVVTFYGVDFQANDLFTLGNTDATNALPIELLSFNAVPQRDAVKLNWETLSERNNDFFTVERSIDGEAWAEVAFVKGAGTTTSKRKYSAYDDAPVNGTSYYRLRQTDFDGAFKYSEVQRVELQGIVHLNVSPNPSGGAYTITSSEDITSSEVRVLDVLGRPVPFTMNRQANSVSVEPLGVAAGIYFIHVATPSWTRAVRVVRE